MDRMKQYAVKITLPGHRTDWGTCGQNRSKFIGQDSNLTDATLATLKMLLCGVSIVLQHHDDQVVDSPNGKT